MSCEESLCDKCSALCCRNFALPIDNPNTAGQFDDIRWYLCHENVVVFVEDKQWYIGILNRCKHLMKDNRCAIYHNRPRICRSYSTDNCEYHGGDYEYEHLFTSAEQLETYARKRLLKARKRRKAKTGTESPAWSRKELLLKRKPNGDRALSLPLLQSA
jgi:Fe-S-cluster containining protein